MVWGFRVLGVFRLWGFRGLGVQGFRVLGSRDDGSECYMVDGVRFSDSVMKFTRFALWFGFSA